MIDVVDREFDVILEGTYTCFDVGEYKERVRKVRAVMRERGLALLFVT